MQTGRQPLLIGIAPTRTRFAILLAVARSREPGATVMASRRSHRHGETAFATLQTLLARSESEVPPGRTSLALCLACVVLIEAGRTRLTLQKTHVEYK